MKKILLLFVILFTFTLSACDDNESLPMYEVVFMIDNDTIYLTEYVKPNNEIAKPDDPTLEGYKFLYWQLDDVEYNFNNEINENFVLIAKWSII